MKTPLKAMKHRCLMTGVNQHSLNVQSSSSLRMTKTVVVSHLSVDALVIQNQTLYGNFHFKTSLVVFDVNI